MTNTQSTANRLTEAALALIGGIAIVYLLTSLMKIAGLGSLPSMLDYASNSVGLAGVYLARRENSLCWPISILGGALLGLCFYNLHLYGQATLQGVFFLPLQIRGWMLWSRGTAEGPLHPSYLTWKSRLTLAGLMVLGILVSAAVVQMTALDGTRFSLWGIQHRLWEASILVSAIVAQTLTVYKKMENWPIWIFLVNVNSMLILVHQGAYLYTALYSLFLINAAIGWYQWSQRISGDAVSAAEQPSMP